MNTAQRVVKNAAVLYAANIVTNLVFLFLTILIARRLGDIVYGKFSFAYAFTTIFAVFLSLGFDTLIVRNVARDRAAAARYLSNIAAIKIILSVAIFGLMAITIRLMDYPADTTTAVLIFGVFIILTAFANTFKVTFRAFEKMEYEAAAEISGKVVTVALAAAALFLDRGLTEICLAFALGSLCDLAITLIISHRKFVKPCLKWDWPFWKTATRAAVPLGFIFIAATVFNRIDTVMLSPMKGDQVVAWYNAAFTLLLALKQAPYILTSAVLPMMSRYFITSRDAMHYTARKFMYYLFVIGLPLAIGTTMLAEQVIHLFYGPEFLPAVIILQILSWNILMYFISSSLDVMLVAGDRQNQMALAIGIACVVNVVLNLILIPFFSYIGAAAASTVTQSVLFGLYYYFVSKHIYRLPVLKIIYRPLIAGAVMAGFLYFAHTWRLYYAVPAAVIIYFLSLAAARGISSDDMALIRQSLRLPRARAYHAEEKR